MVFWVFVILYVLFRFLWIVVIILDVDYIVIKILIDKLLLLLLDRNEIKIGLNVW